MKRLLYKIIKFFGYKIIGASETVKDNDVNAVTSFIFKKFLDVDKPIIFDIGANLGQSIERYSKYFPNKKIYSFEPAPDTFNRMKKKIENTEEFKKGDIKLFNIAIDNNNSKQKFYYYKHHTISSLLPSDSKSKFYKSRVLASKSKKNDFEKVLEVQTKKIDDFCKELNINHIDILKIDVQGTEDRVLEGCKELLSKQKIKLIRIELILGFAYKKNLAFYDIEKTLTPFGYKLILIENGGNLISYSNYQTDLIYVRNDIEEKIKALHYENISIAGVTKKTDESNPFSY